MPDPAYAGCEYLRCSADGGSHCSDWWADCVDDYGRYRLSVAICAALAVFAVTAERIGLVPAAFLTVIVASLPDRSLPFRGKAILGCVDEIVS